MRLNQVTVGVGDIPAAVAFYQTLGLRLIVRSAHYARFECGEGEESATFSVHLDPNAKGQGLTVVYFEDDDLDASVARLQGVGLVFESLPVDQPWLWREAYLRDPSGNRICLYRAGESRRFPPWRVVD